MYKKLFAKLLALPLGFALLGLPSVLAQTQDCPSPDACKVNVSTTLNITGQDQIGSITALFGKLIDGLILLVGTVALVLIVVAGFRMALSGGNDTAVQKSKEQLTYAVIGLALAISAYFIVATTQWLIYGG